MKTMFAYVSYRYGFPEEWDDTSSPREDWETLKETGDAGDEWDWTQIGSLSEYKEDYWLDGRLVSIYRDKYDEVVFAER